MAGLSAMLADDVPERGVDCRQRVDRHAAASVPARRVVHVAPARFRIEGIAARQHRGEAVAVWHRSRGFHDRAHDCGVGDRFAVTDDARVGVDADQQHFLCPVGLQFDLGTRRCSTSMPAIFSVHPCGGG
jgi:hypothetical protein